LQLPPLGIDAHRPTVEHTVEAGTLSIVTVAIIVQLVARR
jgi:hypothetical protein